VTNDVNVRAEFKELGHDMRRAGVYYGASRRDDG